MSSTQKSQINTPILNDLLSDNSTLFLILIVGILAILTGTVNVILYNQNTSNYQNTNIKLYLYGSIIVGVLLILISTVLYYIQSRNTNVNKTNGIRQDQALGNCKPLNSPILPGWEICNPPNEKPYIFTPKSHEFFFSATPYENTILNKMRSSPNYSNTGLQTIQPPQEIIDPIVDCSLQPPPYSENSLATSI